MVEIAPPQVAAAWLTAATTDLHAFLEAFAREMTASLPSGRVTVRRRFVRWFPPKLVIASIIIRLDAWHYTIDNWSGAARYLKAQDSRGVALQSNDIGIADWLIALAQDLIAQAERAGAQNAALAGLLAAAPPATVPTAVAVKGNADMPNPPGTEGLPNAALSRLRARADGKRRAFTSDLSINEFLMVREAGFAPAGLVLGSSLYHVGFQFAGFKTNQELDVLSKAMYHARELAMTRMVEEAAQLGADGVVGVELSIRRLGWNPEVMEFVAQGTAIGHAKGNPGFKGRDGRPFTSHLSGQDFWSLLQTGHRPLAMAMGCCVYHIAHQGFMQSMRNIARNTEVPEYTQAYYNSRELAMERMQTEADREGAAGIVGVLLSEGSHIWESHVVEFFALGTAVTPIEDAAALPEKVRPQIVLPIGG
jgi:uncharacterized protein YbjQ (UPF0145 family)